MKAKYLYNLFFIILLVLIFKIEIKADEMIIGRNYNNPADTVYRYIGVIPQSDTEKRVASMPVYLTGQTSDTTKLIIQPRIFDNQEFTYINNATATDSTLISFVKTGEIKVFEGETYTANLVKFGIGGDTETSTGLIGKLKSITYTKP